MKQIDSNKTVYQLIKENPELKAILVNLGFTPLEDDKMLNTVGRMMPLKRGAKQVGIGQEKLIETLNQHGYEVKE